MKRAHFTEAQHRAQSDRDRTDANPHPAGTPDHDGYNRGWQHAAHKGPRTAQDRQSPGWIKGVTNGLQWKRRNNVG